MAKLTIIRGIPGTGKSALARKLNPLHNVAADDFMIDPETGEYSFDEDSLTERHRLCYEQIVSWLEQGKDCVVHNTFVRWRNITPYVNYCDRKGHEVEVISLSQEYGSIHNVPEETIKRMRRDFEW